jgi:hypothetical protein
MSGIISMQCEIHQHEHLHESVHTFGHYTSGNLSFVLMFWSNRRVFVRRRVGERMISVCVVLTMKHGGVMVWGCFAGDTVSDLFMIHGTLYQHGYHSILQRYAIPSDLRLVGQSFVFQQENDTTHLQAA